MAPDPQGVEYDLSTVSRHMETKSIVLSAIRARAVHHLCRIEQGLLTGSYACAFIDTA